MLNIPPEPFKEPKSPFFGPKNAQKNYVMHVPDIFGLYKLLDEYLNVSRPWLLKNYYPECPDYPLFVASFRSKSARMVPVRISRIYTEATRKYLVENKWRGTGINNVKRHGPHSARHIRGTAIVKKTHSIQMAADANHNSEKTARQHYARYLPEERNREVNDALFGK